MTARESGPDDPAIAAENAHPDRAWRIARWIGAVSALLVLIAVLVVGGFALYYAKKASDANAAQQVRDTRNQIVAAAAKATLLITQADDVIKQVKALTTKAQGEAANAQKQAAATQAEVNKALADAKTTAAQTNALLTEIEQTQKETSKQLATISDQLAAIEKAAPQSGAATTTTG